MQLTFRQPVSCLQEFPAGTASRASAVSKSVNRSLDRRGTAAGSEAGLSLVELIVTVAILAILASAAVPLARFRVQREKERELRRDLWEMRDAIDHYKDAADRGGFQIKVDSQGYPPDLETLVTGVDVQGKKVKFLRRVPVDPMTNKAEWGLHSMQDDPTSDSYGGPNVFDVYSKSQATAVYGTPDSELVVG